MEKPLETAWVDLQIGWGNSQDDETQKWYPPVGGELNKETIASASTSAWEKAPPPILAPKPDNSVPPCMSLAPFELLSQYGSSEGMNLSKSAQAL